MWLVASFNCYCISNSSFHFEIFFPYTFHSFYLWTFIYILWSWPFLSMVHCSCYFNCKYLCILFIRSSSRWCKSIKVSYDTGFSFLFACKGTTVTYWGKVTPVCVTYKYNLRLISIDHPKWSVLFILMVSCNEHPLSHISWDQKKIGSSSILRKIFNNN
jgi:hypothetical protein